MAYAITIFFWLFLFLEIVSMHKSKGGWFIAEFFIVAFLFSCALWCSFNLWGG